MHIGFSKIKYSNLYLNISIITKQSMRLVRTKPFLKHIADYTMARQQFGHGMHNLFMQEKTCKHDSKT